MTPRFGTVVRRDRGLMTATDASSTARVSKSFWSDVEPGRRLPSLAVAARMCGAVVGNYRQWIVALTREQIGDDQFDLLRDALTPLEDLIRQIEELPAWIKDFDDDTSATVVRLTDVRALLLSERPEKAMVKE